ncbi:MAG: DUF2752 domain-containing protein [Sedimentisphaerales bacterium]|nr:DUF2752 domain-containing protein [Sedimentisphaerales bacterium]
MKAEKRYFLTGFLAVTLGLIYWFDPAETHIFPSCQFYTLTGLYCPGCGTMRAFHQLLHGSLTGALSMNPLMVIALPVVLLLYLRKKWAYYPWVAWCSFATLVSYGILRNIHLWPFILLAPK